MENPVRNQTHYSWEWPVAIGALLVILGILALAVPVATSAALAGLLGVLFLVSGVAQLIHAFRFVRQSGTVSRFLLSALSIVAGVLMLRFPLGGMMGITLALSFYMIMNGVARWSMARELRHARGSGLIMASSIISFLLGLYLIITFPVSSLFVPGIFFGVDLIFFGSSMIGLALMVRRAEKEIALPQERRAA